MQLSLPVEMSCLPTYTLEEKKHSNIFGPFCIFSSVGIKTSKPGCLASVLSAIPLGQSVDDTFVLLQRSNGVLHVSELVRDFDDA